jgi:polyisoprenyl-teichoic acid--peptidoglycan teichoic acid transferase
MARLDPATSSRETHSAALRRQRRPGYRDAARRWAGVRRALVVLATIALAGFVVAGVLLAIYVNDVNTRLRPDAAAIGDALAEPPGFSEPYYVLIMGSDRRPGETNARTDTLILARVDPGEKRATLVSIPRDTRVEIPGHSTTKINAASAWGGPELAIRTVADFTGLPISHYIEMDFEGFKEIVDALGGVTVAVPHAIDDPLAANYDTRYQSIPAGVQRLSGAHALTFVRSRAYPEGDLMRIQNQQAFLRALLAEITKVQNPLRLKRVLDAFVDNVSTDLSAVRLLSLANGMRGMDIDALEAVTIPGTPEYLDGVSYVIADEEAMREMLSRIDQGLPATQADAEAGDASAPEPGSITVAVRNGAGISGLAAAAVSRLVPQGFEVVETGNASQFVYDETLIVHRDAEDKAVAVRDVLGTGRVVPSRGMYTFDADVLVVVGKDWPGSTTP